MFLLIILLSIHKIYAQAPGQWTTDQANQWYLNLSTPVGSNYIPSYAINQLEFWQEDTFNATRIDEELGWAEQLGMNTMRVFLHDLAWWQDPKGFKTRMDTFLSTAARHNLRPFFVFFDSCWDPMPKVGKQRVPRPGIHNSGKDSRQGKHLLGWVQSPGARALENSFEYPRLQAYVKDVIGTFANDSRVLMWDMWNEPEDLGCGNYPGEDPPNKWNLVLNLLPQVFQWARSVNPTQPLTSGISNGDYGNGNNTFTSIALVQMNNSDIITFHQ